MARHPLRPNLPPMILVHWLDADSEAGDANPDAADPDAYSVGFYTQDDLKRLLATWRDWFTDGATKDRGRIPLGTIQRWAYMKRSGPWRSRRSLRHMLLPEDYPDDQRT